MLELRKVGRNSVVLATMLALAGCDESKPATDGADTKDPGAATSGTDVKPEAKEPVAAPQKSRREDLETWRPLLDEVTRAELRSTGLHMNLGEIEGNKFTRGAWLNGWGSPKKTDDGTSYLEVYSGSVRLDFTTIDEDADIKEIVFRARTSCKNTKVAGLVDGKSVSSVEVGSDWGVHRIALEESGQLSAGVHSIAFNARGKCSGKVRAEIDWVWLATERKQDPPKLYERQQPSKLGGSPRRALISEEARTYSFYMQVPSKGELVFDHAAKAAGTKLEIFVTTDGGKRESVWSGEAGTEWKEAAVSLSKFAGKAARVDFTSSGEVAWGELDLLVEPAPKPKVERTASAKNVVVILIDTVRADVFEPFGGEGSKVKTPAFDAMTKEATVFSSAYDNENWTKPSVATVLSGLYPVTHNAKEQNSVLDADIELMSERLKKEGFKTGGFIANGYVSDKFGFQQGWDSFTNYIREGKNSRAENVYNDAIKFLEKNKDERFFLYVQTIDPHVPYRFHDETTPQYVDEKYKGTIGKMLSGKTQADLSGNHEKLTDKDYDWIRGLYYGEVTYHDLHMKRLMDKLAELGLKEDTLIVITNDHGEELDDHGKMGHGHSLYDEVVRAPLLIQFPGRVPGGQVMSEPVESVDIAPTMLELLGLNPSSEHEGMSLVPLMEGRVVQRPHYSVTEFLKAGRSVKVGDYKMIGSSSKWRHLFNTKLDPGEQNNLIDKSFIARRMCELHLTEALANPNKRFRQLKTRTGRTFKSKDVEMDPELRKQLEALGYFHDE